MSLLALGIGPGDEVIVPSFTFFATASAVWRLGAKPVFADIRPDTFNLDPADVLYKLTTATKAIIPVHLFGQCAEMDEIRQIATRRAAFRSSKTPARRSAPSTTAGGPARSARPGAFSFYPTKNLGGFGDGGLITTNDGELAAKLRVLRDHGQQPRYYHHFVGLNSRLDALQAAVLSVKLPEARSSGRRRGSGMPTRYAAEFAERGIERRDRRAATAEGCRPRVEPVHGARRRTAGATRCRKYLADRKIGSAIYYPVPLHLQKCFASLGYEAGQLAGHRASLPRGAVAARVSGADGARSRGR